MKKNGIINNKKSNTSNIKITKEGVIITGNLIINGKVIVPTKNNQK